MSLYIIIGCFLDESELKKIKEYETIRRISVFKKPQRNSCSHLSDNVYKNKTTNYCPECGIKVNLFPEEPEVYNYKKRFIGYSKGFFEDFKATKKCGCIKCNFCICENCEEDCSKCKCEDCKNYYDCDNDIIDVFNMIFETTFLLIFNITFCYIKII